MIKIDLQLDQAGWISSLSSNGHAEHKEPLLCGLISVLLKSFGHLIAEKDGLQVSGTADRPGHFVVKCQPESEKLSDWLIGVSAQILSQLEVISSSYPESIVVKIIEGESDGA